MIDMRKSKQEVLGFYIWKNHSKKYWEVGKNGTSIHTTIPFSEHARIHLIGFIMNNGEKNND